MARNDEVCVHRMVTGAGFRLPFENQRASRMCDESTWNTRMIGMSESLAVIGMSITMNVFEKWRMKWK